MGSANPDGCEDEGSMFSIIGIVVVFGCIVAGYLMEHGNMKVLLQPAELIIIGGAALGTVLISNPVHTLKQMISGVIGVFGSSKYGTQRYVESLKMMYELLQKARKEGWWRWSRILKSRRRVRCSQVQGFVKDHHAVAFVCDTMRMAVTGAWRYSIWIRCWTRTWKCIIARRAIRSRG